MNASELREGDYLQGVPFSIPKCGIYSKGVTRITAYGIYMLSQGYGEYKPIGLTEEWLLRCGFKKLDIDGLAMYRLEYEDDDNYFKIDFDFEIFDCLTINGDFSIHNGFKYVHQIQSLYFSLLGQELSIKENMSA